MKKNKSEYVIFLTHSPQVEYYNIFAKVLKQYFNINSVAWVIGDFDYKTASILSFDQVINLNSSVEGITSQESINFLEKLESKHKNLCINLNISFDRHYKRENWKRNDIIKHLANIARNTINYINSNHVPLMIIGEANTGAYRLINQITDPIPKMCPMVIGHFKNRFYFETDVLYYSWPDLSHASSIPETNIPLETIKKTLIEKIGTQTQKIHLLKGTFGLMSKLSLRVMRKRLKTDLANIKRKKDSWDPKIVSIKKTNAISSSYRFFNNLIQSKLVRYYSLGEIPKKESFGVFFLHFQPEITVDGLGYTYADQDTAIRLISNSLPISETLLVKEHPLMIGKRGLAFFKKIKSFHNVQLIDDRVNSFDLIEKSKYVISITGSAGLEALFLGKPVFVLGSIFHNKLRGVYEVNDIKNLPKFIKKFSNKSHKILSDVSKEAINKMWNASYPGKLGHTFTLSEMSKTKNKKLIASAFKDRFLNDL